MKKYFYITILSLLICSQAFGLDSGANMSALHAMVVAIRAALVANGIMS